MKKKTFDWFRDCIHDPVGTLTQANHLWEIQAFTEPSLERKEEIIHLLKIAKDEIESILEELESCK